MHLIIIIINQKPVRDNDMKHILDTLCCCVYTFSEIAAHQSRLQETLLRQACVHFSQSFESRRKGYALFATVWLQEYEAYSRRLSFSQVMLNARFLIEPESSDKTD